MSAELERRRREHQLRSKAQGGTEQFELSLEKLRVLESAWQSTRNNNLSASGGEKLSLQLHPPQAEGLQKESTSKPMQTTPLINRIKPGFHSSFKSENEFSVPETGQSQVGAHQSQREENLRASMQTLKSPPVPRVILNTGGLQVGSLRDTWNLGGGSTGISSARVGSPKAEQLFVDQNHVVASARVYQPEVAASQKEKLDISKAFQELEAIKSKLHSTSTKPAVKLADPQEPTAKIQKVAAPRSPKTQAPPVSSPRPAQKVAIPIPNSPSPKPKTLPSPNTKKVVGVLRHETAVPPSNGTSLRTKDTGDRNLNSPIAPSKNSKAKHTESAMPLKDSGHGVKERVDTGKGKVGKQTVLTAQPQASTSAHIDKSRQAWSQMMKGLHSVQQEAGTDISVGVLEQAFEVFLSQMQEQLQKKTVAGKTHS